MPSPAPAREPLTWWQEAWRLAAAAMAGLFFWLVQFVDLAQEQGVLHLLDLALGLCSLVLLHWRRRWPFAVTLLITIATGISATAVGPALVATISLVTTRRWRAIAVASVVGVASAFVMAAVYPSKEPLPWWALLLINVLFTGILIAIGLYIEARRALLASYRERAETAEREQASRMDQARANERARIAREMHDVLAHRISLVAMHAGAMTYRTDLSREEMAQAAQVVQENAHRALTDLRDVLGVLHGSDRGTADGADRDDRPERPQPTLADLRGLLDEATVAGTPVRLRDELGEPATVPQTVGRTAYRIIQEALTNARKHAPGTPVAVHLSGLPGGRLSIEVRNPLLLRRPTVGRQPPGAGMGLVGLVERTALAGGELRHGATGQEYVVRAWLPWAA